MQDLLCEWINETLINDKLFVMRWGYPLSKKPGKVNYAESVWSKADKLVQDKPNVRTFDLIHHPTYPREDNYFSKDAPENFKEITEHYKTIFNTPDVRDILASTMSNLAISKKS